MRVAVLGAGIIGVTTAWQLLKDGHDVTIIERNDDAAAFTSFANAGLIAPAHAYAWASPAAPGMMWRSMINADQAIRFKPRPDPRQWSWVMSFLKECTAERARINTLNKARLCIYSQQVLGEVAAETGIAYDRNTGGLMYWYRSPASFRTASAKADILRSVGLAIEAMTPEAVAGRDPGLAAARAQIAGGLFAPSDESGDCMLFARGLLEACRQRGATVLTGRAVRALKAGADGITHAETDAGPLAADAFVVCLGIAAPALVKPFGIALPIYPVKGYSMTLPITDPSRAPRMGGVDENNLLAYCPMGQRLRITATAEIAGYDDSHRPADFTRMLERTRAVFPAGIDYGRAEMWAGLRPMTPTGMPVIDRTHIANLFLNAGHGHVGWTMSNGSARVLADLVGQRQPAIAMDGMRL